MIANATSRHDIGALVKAGVAEFKKKMGRPASAMEMAIIQMGLVGHAVDRIDVPPDGKAN